MTGEGRVDLTYRPTWRVRYLAPGCLFAMSGFFGGGMIAVLVAKMVGTARGCRPPDGLPACNTFEFLLAGGLLGMVLLPAVAIWRIRQSDAMGRHSQRG